jgi:hypothetical protein
MQRFGERPMISSEMILLRRLRHVRSKSAVLLFDGWRFSKRVLTRVQHCQRYRLHKISQEISLSSYHSEITRETTMSRYRIIIGGKCHGRRFHSTCIDQVNSLARRRAMAASSSTSTTSLPRPPPSTITTITTSILQDQLTCAPSSARFRTHNLFL